MATYNRMDLESLGFKQIGKWVEISGALDIQKGPTATGALWEARPALYAFVSSLSVKYIGKTSRSIRDRLCGYKTPGKAQPTNIKCNAKIRKLIKDATFVDILGFCPDINLNYGDHQIDLAAGLENALIQNFKPEWNGRSPRSNTPLTESERIETEALGATPLQPAVPTANAARFQIMLQDTYYNKGYINPGIDVDQAIGGHGEDIIIYLGNLETTVMSVISRKAVSNECARINSRIAIAKWFQENFRLGDTVEAEVLNEHAILLKLPQATNAR